MKIVITGSPKAGKTHLSETLGKILKIPVFHTDELKHLEWSEASESVSYWFSRPDPWIIEGVAVPRGLRKWIARQSPIPEAVLDISLEVPFDRIVVIRTPREALELQGQKTMQKTVLDLIDSYKPWIGEERWVEL